MIEAYFNQISVAVRARYRASPLPTFLGWWGHELYAFVPQSVRQRLMPPRPEVWIVPAASGGGDLRIWRPGDPPERLDVFGAGEDVELLRGRWQEVLSGFTDGAPEIRLCLPEDHLLEVPVNLPMAVEDNLRQTLGYQLDQLTPFRADQALFGQQVVRRDLERGRIEVLVKLIPKSAFQPVRDRLGQLGIAPHVVDTLSGDSEHPEPEGFNLLPEDQRPRFVHARARLNWALAAGFVVLLAGVMAQSLYLRGQTVAGLEAEADRLRGEARAVLDLQQQLEDAQLAANFLAERRRQQPVNVAVLADLTERLPDDIWLQQYRLQGSELFVQGLADGSQRVISLLNDSELMDEAEFRGSISIDQATGRERFQANAIVRMPAALIENGADPIEGGQDAIAPES